MAANVTAIDRPGTGSGFVLQVSRDVSRDICRSFCLITGQTMAVILNGCRRAAAGMRMPGHHAPAKREGRNRKRDQGYDT